MSPQHTVVVKRALGAATTKPRLLSQVKAEGVTAAAPHGAETGAQWGASSGGNRSSLSRGKERGHAAISAAAAALLQLGLRGPAVSPTWIPFPCRAGRLVGHWHFPAVNFKAKPEHVFDVFKNKHCWIKSLPCQVSVPALSHLLLPLLKLPCVHKRGSPLKFYTKILWVWGEGQTHTHLTHVLPSQLHLNFSYKTAQILKKQKNCRKFDGKKKKNYITAKTWSIDKDLRSNFIKPSICHTKIAFFCSSIDNRVYVWS